MNKQKRFLPLFDIKVDLPNDLPICQSKCPNQVHCANHVSANMWVTEYGATPDLRQVVPGSWRCHRMPKEQLKGAVMVDGTSFGDFIQKGPDWNDGVEGFNGDNSF